MTQAVSGAYHFDDTKATEATRNLRLAVGKSDRHVYTRKTWHARQNLAYPLEQYDQEQELEDVIADSRIESEIYRQEDQIQVDRRWQLWCKLGLF